MSNGVSKLYADRFENFRRMQESLSRLSFGDLEINLGDIANGNVYLDDDGIFYIDRIPARGDYVIVSHDPTDYQNKKDGEIPDVKKFIESKMNLSSLSMNIIDELLRLMKKAIIIEEIRSLN